MTDSSVRYTLCNRDCPDGCEIEATVEHGRVTRLRGSRRHPVTRGFLCYRTNRFLEAQYSPRRLTQPLYRRGGPSSPLEPIGWTEALDIAARELQRTRDQLGPEAIFYYRSGGSLGMLPAVGDRFFSLFGPVTTKRGDICSGAGIAAQERDFGVCTSGHVSEMASARHVLLWGKNVVTSSPHLVPLLRQTKARGASLTLIDPVWHDTAKLCDLHLQPRPGGDLDLALGVARVLFDRGWCHPELERFAEGVDTLRALALGRSVEQWAERADVSATSVVDLARKLGEEGPVSIQIGWGMARRAMGGAIVRAVDALAVLSGNIGVRGAGPSYYHPRRRAFDLSCVATAPPPRTILEPHFGVELAALTDPPVDAVWITCANPVTMLPESEATARALASRRFVVVVDSQLTDTAELATLVLPTTTLLEADDLLASYGHHLIGVSQPVVPPPPDVLSDLQIIQGLAERVGLGEQIAGSAREWKTRMIGSALTERGVTLEALEQCPVPSPLTPEIAYEGRRFPTPSGKAQLLTELPENAEPPPDGYPLTLMSLSTRQAQSSQWSVEPPTPLPLTVHPDSACGVTDGAECYLESPIGRLRVLLRHDRRQRRDVALVPKGGHRRLGAAANTLVRARTTDLGEGGALYDERVRIAALS